MEKMKLKACADLLELHDHCKHMAREADGLIAAIRYGNAPMIKSVKRYYEEYYRRYKHDTEGIEYCRAAAGKRICDILEEYQETTPKEGGE